MYRYVLVASLSTRVVIGNHDTAVGRKASTRSSVDDSHHSRGSCLPTSQLEPLIWYRTFTAFNSEFCDDRWVANNFRNGSQIRCAGLDALLEEARVGLNEEFVPVRWLDREIVMTGTVKEHTEITQIPMCRYIRVVVVVGNHDTVGRMQGKASTRLSVDDSQQSRGSRNESQSNLYAHESTGAVNLIPHVYRLRQLRVLGWSMGGQQLSQRLPNSMRGLGRAFGRSKGLNQEGKRFDARNRPVIRNHWNCAWNHNFVVDYG
jgi:hypothetical protein